MKLGLLTCCELYDSGLSVEVCLIHMCATCSTMDPRVLQFHGHFCFSSVCAVNWHHILGEKERLSRCLKNIYFFK